MKFVRGGGVHGGLSQPRTTNIGTKHRRDSRCLHRVYLIKVLPDGSELHRQGINLRMLVFLKLLDRCSSWIFFGTVTAIAVLREQQTRILHTI